MVASQALSAGTPWDDRFGIGLPAGLDLARAVLPISAALLVLLLLALSRFRETRAKWDARDVVAFGLGVLWIAGASLLALGAVDGEEASGQPWDRFVGHLLLALYLLALAAASRWEDEAVDVPAIERRVLGLFGSLVAASLFAMLLEPTLSSILGTAKGLSDLLFHAVLFGLAAASLVLGWTGTSGGLPRASNVAVWGLVAGSQLLHLVVVDDPDRSTVMRLLEAPTFFLHIPAIFLLVGSRERARNRAERFAVEQRFAELVGTLSGVIQMSARSSPEVVGSAAELARGVAARLGLDEEERRDVYWATLVRDLGKLGLDREVLTSAERPSPAQWAQIRRHPELGAELLEKVRGLENVARIVRHHHETWNGSGYPDGLRGAQIPTGSRIVYLIDALDAMICGRPYQSAMPLNEAIETIRTLAGIHFDPQVVDAFVEELRSRGVPLVPEEAALGLLFAADREVASDAPRPEVP